MHFQAIVASLFIFNELEMDDEGTFVANLKMNIQKTHSPL